MENAGTGLPFEMGQFDQGAFPRTAFADDAENFIGVKVEIDRVAGDHRAAVTADVGLRLRSGCRVALRAAGAENLAQIAGLQQGFHQAHLLSQ